MRSRLTLLLHTILFFCFAFGSLASPFLATQSPNISPWYFIATTVFLFAFVVGSWLVYGGCPFTIWENAFREKERRGSSYRGPCIDHYAYAWFRIRISEAFSTTVLVILLLLPAAVGISHLL